MSDIVITDATPAATCQERADGSGSRLRHAAPAAATVR